jgi:putative transposase
MPSRVLTYRYRLKDSTSGKPLQRMGWAVNTVWNFCNEVAMLAWRRDRRWLTAYDLINLTGGSSKELGLHSDTIAEVCREYATRRKQFRKRRLKWRSRKHSLGWVPFKVRFLRLEGDSIFYLGRRFRFWLSRPIEGKPKTGSFTQDARGRWYVNLQCEVEDSTTPIVNAEIGIDLGLKDQATCSDGIKYNRENLTRRYEDDLAMAQRARKKRRVKAIHARIGNKRKDWAHKKTTDIVRRAKLLVVGDVSSSRLAKTRFAKSIYDAGWHQLRAFLEYKANRLGVHYCEVNESGSSVRCSACGFRTGPSGLRALGVREWTCSTCGVSHDRDINAAHNILRLGRQTLAGGIS